MKDAFLIVPKFPLGEAVITRGALSQLVMEDVWLSLHRHSVGDWGLVCTDDWEENELSLREGYRLMSIYEDRNARTFWVITEWDRSVTTVILPDEY